MAELIRLTLPWPPTVNTYWRAVNGRNIISKRGREYREAAILSIWAACANLGLENPLAVEVAFFPPDCRRRDIDNLSKALLDAMQHGGVYRDDSQIVDLHLMLREVVPGGRVDVSIRTLEE